MPFTAPPEAANVDKFIETAVLSQSSTEPTLKAITECDNHGSKSGLESIAVTPQQGKLLQLLARSANAQRILEVGTLAGVSTIYLATSTPTTKVTTIDIEANSVKVAGENAEREGVKDRIDFRLGPGLEVLATIESDLKNKSIEPFDFVFIDADKSNNSAYFDYAVRLCRKGAAIVVDNVIQQGRILDENELKSHYGASGAKAVIESVGRDSRVDATVIQTVGGKGYDGFIMAVVR